MSNTLDPDQAQQFVGSDLSAIAFKCYQLTTQVLLDFSLTVKAAPLIFISGCGLASPSAKEGKSGFIYNWSKC